VDPRLRNTLVLITAAFLAVVLGWQLAQGIYAWAALASLGAVAAILVFFTKTSTDVTLLSLLIVGYIVGNRGFAQLTPAPGLIFLPAEACLVVTVGWLLIQCAFARELPFQRDALNWAVLAWLVAGTVRVVFDVPTYGISAARDYATIYYAAFFFLAQHMSRKAAARKHLTNAFIFAALALLPMYVLFQFFPMFFLEQLVVSGIPLIYYKGDLAVTFLAVSSLLIFHWAKGPNRYWAWPLSAGMFLYVLSGENRASLLGLVLASVLLLSARHWRFPLLQGAVAASALIVAVALATLFDNAWSKGKLEGLNDRLQSIVDVRSTGNYQSVESSNKGDNNRFRFVWWSNVVSETWRTNPVFGLGFGADLARGFVQEYYPDATEEFSTRSPHNIFVTTFGRMGFVGLAIWSVFCAVLLRKTRIVLRRSKNPMLWSLWCSVWVILISACFGVVLEGPMGAVIFWTALGLANAAAKEPSELATEMDAADTQIAVIA
jgi:hypothetical protein